MIQMNSQNRIRLTDLATLWLPVGKDGGAGESGRWGSGVEGESGEVSRPVGELDEGEGEGWPCGG